ncbi:MAG: GatB/YqeY domain-containing protein [Thermoanaerobaculia bacterium]
MSAQPVARVQADLTAAMKAGDKERTSTLRLLLNAVKNEGLAARAEVDEPRFLALVQKGIKQRRESVEAFRGGGREELAAKEEREIELLASYLPPPASEEELRAAIAAFVAERGLAGPQALGPIMKEMTARFAGRADGGTIGRLARQMLG